MIGSVAMETCVIGQLSGELEISRNNQLPPERIE